MTQSSFAKSKFPQCALTLRQGPSFVPASIFKNNFRRGLRSGAGRNDIRRRCTMFKSSLNDKSASIRAPLSDSLFWESRKGA
jgi:hypothetical protein